MYTFLYISKMNSNLRVILVFIVCGQSTVVDSKLPQKVHSTEDCVATVKQGTMQGSIMYSEKGKPFCAFRGIPYSQPPLGHYRFKDPRPPQPWNGLLDATKENPQCIHVKLFLTVIEGQEDCLYLSVFTPQHKQSDGHLVDVIVWIYPGEFYFGSSSSSVAGPHFFMDKDVIMVYISYRIGAFGFLSTGDDESPGNYGLKDQVAALHWVQDNIEEFGGNPNRVTLLGQSSGASCSHLHMMSPLAKGLFHQVISMEGTAIHPWARCPDPLRQAQKQALAVQCPTEPSSSLIVCLRETDAVQLTKSIYDLFSWWILPGSGYGPVIEQKTERNPNPYLIADPLELMRTGRFEHVPWLMGGNTEGIATFSTPTATMDLLQLQAQQHTQYLKQKVLMLDVSVPQDQISNTSNRIIQFYGTSDDLNPHHIIRMLSDRLLIHSVHKSAQLHALAGHGNIYKYNFGYKGIYSVTQFFTFQNLGVAHSDELNYIFKMAIVKLLYPQGHNDLEVRELLLSMWTNFVKYGNPTPGNTTDNDLVNEIIWYPIGNVSIDNLHIQYLNIGQVITSNYNKFMNQGKGPVKLNMATDLYKKHMDFWDALPLNENCLTDC